MTQVVRYGRMLKANITSIQVRVRIAWEQTGSVFAGTFAVVCKQVESDLEVESNDSPPLVAAVIHNAKAGCFAEAALRQPVDVKSTVRLNGEEFDYARFPKKPPRP